jgi:hypothetical protein
MALLAFLMAISGLWILGLRPRLNFGAAPKIGTGELGRCADFFPIRAFRTVCEAFIGIRSRLARPITELRDFLSPNVALI